MSNTSNIKEKNHPLTSSANSIYGKADLTDETDSRLLSLLLTNTEESFLLLDRDLNIQLYNEKTAVEVKTLMGLTLQKGMSIFQLAQPGRKEILQKLYAEVLNGAQHESEVQLAVPGGERHIYTLFRPAKNEKGEVIGVIILSEDVTEKRKKEQEIKESNHNLDLLLNNTNEAFILINKEWEIILFNQKATHIIESYFEKKIYKGLHFLELSRDRQKRN